MKITILHRGLILVGLILFLLSGCKPKEDKYKLENEMLSCAYSYFEEEGIDLKLKLDSVENILIDNNLLKDDTGLSYIDFLNEFSKKGILIFTPEINDELDTIEKIPSDVLFDNFCFADFSFEEIQESELSKFFSITMALKEDPDVKPAKVAEYVVKVFNEDDFNQEFYQRAILLSVLFQLEITKIFRNN